jgi:hypothetical protein
MSSPNNPLDIGITMSGDTNWPKYSAAESSGITVVAESRPPLMLAMVFSRICIDKEWGLSISGSAFLSCVGKCCKVENGVQKMRLKNKRGVKIKKKEILIAIL